MRMGRPEMVAHTSRVRKHCAPRNRSMLPAAQWQAGAAAAAAAAAESGVRRHGRSRWMSYVKTLLCVWKARKAARGRAGKWTPSDGAERAAGCSMVFFAAATSEIAAHACC